MNVNETPGFDRRQMGMNLHWDQKVDCLVVGAGGAGLCAALVCALKGSNVLLCESSDQVGGTTATSGGTIWVPGTRQSQRTASPDSIDQARIYLDQEVGPWGQVELREAFLQAGPDAIDFLERNSDVQFKVNTPYPDYHAEQPGGALGGRALSPLPMDGRLLGSNFSKLRPPRPEFMVLRGMMVGRDEIKYLIRPWRSWQALKITSKLIGSYLWDRLNYPRGTRLLLGNALVGRLFMSLLKAGGKVSYKSRLIELILDERRVVGAVVEINGVTQRIHAPRGVILATGGCAASAQWRADLFKDGPLPHTLAFEGNQGEGVQAAIQAGAQLDRNHASPFFWMPASILQKSTHQTTTYPHIRDRPKPGLIAINAQGRRFVNEANSYHDFVSAMFATHADKPTQAAYLICDRRFIHEYGLGVIHPVWHLLNFFLKKNYLLSAPSLSELALKISVDAHALQETVAQHNQDADGGVDRLFAKGSLALNRYNGDPGQRPNPCLHPLNQAPYFALPVFPAPIGSSVGLKTNAHAQVLGADGLAMEGLYACGNDMSSVMGGRYPGPGITLGPALVFAYLAACHLSE